MYDYTPKIETKWFLPHYSGKWWETVCYCPKCRANGLKIYTVSNGKEERCLNCEPVKETRSQDKPRIYTDTPLRSMILDLCDKEPLTESDLIAKLDKPDYVIKKTLKVMLYHNKLKLDDDYFVIN